MTNTSTMINLYFQVHQPERLRWFFPDETKDLYDRYFDSYSNKKIFNKVASKCYWDTNNTILSLIDEYDFKVSYSVTGTWLDQCERYQSDLMETFVQMARSGQVEFLDETYYHSISSLFDDEDMGAFRDQVVQHRQAMKDLLGVAPTTFRNTELLYNNRIAKTVQSLGYDTILSEGIERVLDDWKSPNYVYKAKDCDLNVLLRNYKLSDDIGYRFSARWWSEFPLTADKWAAWASGAGGDVLNIFMDYETFGEHQWDDTGIFYFLKALPEHVLNYDNLEFTTPSESTKRCDARGEIDVHECSTISWADMERDPSAWLGNDMQQRCFEEIKALEPYVRQTGDAEIKRVWNLLQTSDHYYYACTKWLDDGDVHNYFSHHNSPFDAAVNLMNIITDFKAKVFENLSNKNL